MAIEFDKIKDEVLSNIDISITKDYRSFFNVKRAITNVKKRVSPILKLLIDSTTKDSLRIIQESYLEETWEARNARLITKQANKISESINTLDENIKEDVTRSLARNATLDPKEQLEALLRDTSSKFDSYYTKSRAETIARTNTTATDNEVKRDTWREMGVRELEWITEGDDRVRDSHAAMDGVRIEIDGSFTLEEFDKDGNPTGNTYETPFPAGGQVASQDINCRCTMLPI